MRAVDTSTSARRDRRHAEFRGRLLTAVESLLADGTSYAELTVEQIATAAGTSRSTFYLHFRDKGHLLAEFAGDVMGGMLDVGSPWWSESTPRSRAEVRSGLEAILLRYREHAGLMVAVAETAAFDPGVREVFERQMDEAVEAYADHLRRGQAGGWVTTDLDPDAVSGWLIWMAERGMSRYAAEPDLAALGRSLDALTHVVWSTAYAPTLDRSAP